MSDYQEHQLTSEQPSGRYISLIEPGDKAELTGDEELEIIKFPEKFVGSVGEATVYLSRSTPEYNWAAQKDRTGLYLSGKGLKQITAADAAQQGLYALRIMVENPRARLRNLISFAHISLDGSTDLVSGELENVSQDVEEIRQTSPVSEYRDVPVETTSLTHADWKPATGSNLKLNGELYVSYNPSSSSDRKFLEGLNFRFDMVQQRTGGGV